MSLPKVFENLVKIGVKIVHNKETGKKKVTGMPNGWQNLTESKYNDQDNYAILTGKLNDLFVIDLDNKGDFIAKSWFEQNFFNLGDPSKFPTLVTQTINGGYHVYYRYNDSIKNRNNFLGKNIDILVDKKCVYEGKNYTVLNPNCAISKLPADKLHLFNQRVSKTKTKHSECMELMKVSGSNDNNDQGNKIRTTSLSSLTNLVLSPEGTYTLDNERHIRRINPLIPTSLQRRWEIEFVDGVFKCIPHGNECIITDKHHSENHHCALYINDNNIVTKSCFSCGSVTYPSRLAKKLTNEFYMVLQLQKEEDNIYTRLKDDLVADAIHKLFKRDNLGNIYTRVKSYAYVFQSEPKEYINSIFRGDREFEKIPSNIDNLIKYLKDYDHPQFPFFEPEKRYIGFNNGYFDTHTCNFVHETDITDGDTDTDPVMVKKYIDVPFDENLIGMDPLEISTPLFDSIFEYQLGDKSDADKQEIMKFVYFCIGRLFGIRDKFDFTFYLMGEAGCGKSLVIDIVKQFFRDIGAISSTFEKTFGLASLYQKDIIVCDDLPKDFSKILPQTIFQTCISGGEISIAIKGNQAKTINWDVPWFCAGNYNPDYVDKGQISRRIVTMTFPKIVRKRDVDTKLLSKICATELDKILYKCCKAYNDVLDDDSQNGKNVWSICPQFFLDNQQELKMDRNPLYKFLVEKSVFKKGNMMLMSDIRKQFEAWIGSPVRDLDNGTFTQINEDFIVKRENICKHCWKKAGFGCCGEYNSKKRVLKTVVYNMYFDE